MGEINDTDDSDRGVLPDGSFWGEKNRYRIVKCLGEGGMGEVYLADDTALQRRVAIKTVRPDLSKHAEIRKRIERECLLHAKVGAHPHITTLFDKFEFQGQITLVMELVEGETLQFRMERLAAEKRALRRQETIEIIAQTLDALSRIHAHGIVHRDIKPANIMIARDDHGAICAKLMDFGISRLTEEDENQTRLTRVDGVGPGTPLYMAPEQIDPKSYGPVTSSADLYALGVTLYQMLTGEPPFKGGLSQVFNAHLCLPPPTLQIKPSDSVTAALNRIIQQALAKSPSDRFSSARKFREALVECAETSTAQIPPPLPSTKAQRRSTDTSMPTVLASGRNPAAMEEQARTISSGASVESRAKGRGSHKVLIAAMLVILLGAAMVALAYFKMIPGTAEKARAQAETKEVFTPAVDVSSPSKVPTDSIPALTPEPPPIATPTPRKPAETEAAKAPIKPATVAEMKNQQDEILSPGMKSEKTAPATTPEPKPTPQPTQPEKSPSPKAEAAPAPTKSPTRDLKKAWADVERTSKTEPKDSSGGRRP